MVGCINTGVDFLVFTLLNTLGAHYILCQFAGYSMGVLNSFILNKLWTFENSGGQFNTAMQLGKFICANLVTLGISMLGLAWLRDAGGVDVLTAKVLVTAFIQAVNYMAYKYFVFKRQR